VGHQPVYSPRNPVLTFSGVRRGEPRAFWVEGKEEGSKGSRSALPRTESRISGLVVALDISRSLISLEDVGESGVQLTGKKRKHTPRSPVHVELISEKKCQENWGSRGGEYEYIPRTFWCPRPGCIIRGLYPQNSSLKQLEYFYYWAPPKLSLVDIRAHTCHTASISAFSASHFMSVRPTAKEKTD
jgi:hypothetical protein